jgi:hypothetical protein
MDRQDTEFAWLAERVGMPAAEVPKALGAYDTMFPTANGWLGCAGPTKCMTVKMFPAPFRGLGAWQRRVRYEADDYGKLGYADHTSTDLKKWNNAAVEILAKPEADPKRSYTVRIDGSTISVEAESPESAGRGALIQHFEGAGAYPAETQTEVFEGAQSVGKFIVTAQRTTKGDKGKFERVYFDWSFAASPA